MSTELEPTAPRAQASTPRVIAELIATWAISVPTLTVLYAAFTLLGYALLSIATIPQGQSLSVFYAALIGSGILLAPICLLSLLVVFDLVVFDLDLHSFFSDLFKFGMHHLRSLFVIPIILGGSALGWKILQVSGASPGVDRGHLVAASALGGYIFRMILELLKVFVPYDESQ